MFADSLLDVSWAQRSRRNWTTLTSFGAQATVICLVLLLPLLRTVGLPAGRVLPTPLSWGAPPPAPPIHQLATAIPQSNIARNNVLIAPPSIPRQIAIIQETVAPPPMDLGGSGVQGATGEGTGDGAWESLNDTLARTAPAPILAPTTRTFRTSSMLEGNLIRQVQPVYPDLARRARIQGSVVLAAVISKAGTMENVRVISGHPLLAAAAIDAVSQWRYRPYVLNGEAIEVETQIMVNFKLGS